MNIYGLCKRIQLARKKQGITQKELSAALNMPVSLISQIENAVRVGEHDGLDVTRIANYLGVPIEMPPEYDFFDSPLR